MKLLKSADFMGSEPQTYIFNKTRFKTHTGGILSILSLVTISALSLYFTIIVFTRQQLNLLSSRTTTFEKNLDITKVPILFLPSTTAGVVYNTTITYPIFQLWNYYKENSGGVNITTIPYKQCDSNDITDYEDLFKGLTDLNKYLCLNRSGLSLTLFGSNGDIVNGYSKLQAYIVKCTNGSIYNPNPDKNSCSSSSQIESVLGGTPVHFYMVYPDVNINFQNTGEPFIPYLKTEDFTMPLLALFKYLYMFKKTFISTDYGYVFEAIDVQTTYQFDSIQSTLFLGSSFNIKEAFGVISFALSEKADQHSRSYIKLQTLVANIGGLINFIFIVSKLLVAYITEKSLFLSYINNRQVYENTKQGNTEKSNTTFQLVSFSMSGTTLNKFNLKKQQEEKQLLKHKKMKMSCKDVICPLSLTNRYDLYKKVDLYIRNNLSLNYILQQLDDLEVMKRYVFSTQELYVLDNYDKLKNRMLYLRDKESFEPEKFKSSYQQVHMNQKLISLLQ
jgi:hypothetical protein